MGVTSLVMQFTIIDLLSKGVDKIRERMRALSASNKDVQQSFDRMTRSFKYAAMAGIVTREIHKGLKPAIGMAGDLQSELTKVKAELMGAGKGAALLHNEMKAVKAAAFSIQAWTPFDMTQIVALEKELIKAGATVEQVTSKTGAAVAAAALATYEGVDPVQTGKSLISIATPFKVTADKFMELADQISRASSASTADIEDIVLSAKYAAGPMATLGKSTKEMLALSAVMSQIGLSGETGGRSLKEFFQKAAGVSAFKDAKGNLLPTVTIIAKLRKSMEGLGEADKTVRLEKIFGDLGSRAAIALLMEGKNSYEDIVASMEAAAGLQDKINEEMKGFNAQLRSLKGTFRSTIADLFLPALKPLTMLLEKTNEFIAAIGTVSQKAPGVGKAVSGISLGAAGVGAAATIGLGAAGIYYGRKVLKGSGGIKGLLKGFGSDAAGIAKGKAVEAATGVQPVFVTNWPTGGGLLQNPMNNMPGGGLPLPGGAKALGRFAPLLRGLGIYGGAAAAGIGLGSAFYNKTDPGRQWGDFLAKTLDKVLNISGYKEPEIKNNIPMNITINNDKAIVTNQGMNTETTITLKRSHL